MHSINAYNNIVKNDCYLATYISLFPDIFINSGVLNIIMYFALHHCASIVVFNVSLPSSFGHGWTFGKSLLPKVLDCVVVCVRKEVV